MGKREVLQRKAETDFQRAMALNLSKQYCKENGLSYDKLQKQRFDFFDGVAWFSQPSDIVPLGLINDMETMPMPTLVLKRDGEKIIFEQTEHTKKYLS